MSHLFFFCLKISICYLILKISSVTYNSFDIAIKMCYYFDVSEEQFLTI